MRKHSLRSLHVLKLISQGGVECFDVMGRIIIKTMFCAISTELLLSFK